MTPERYKRITELFLEAVELNGAQRESFLDEACEQDPELRQEVDALLAHDSAETIFSQGNQDRSDPSDIKVASTSGRTRRWLHTARLTRYLSPRGQFALGAFAAVLFLILLALIAHFSIVSFQSTLREAALREILDAKISGLEMWIESEQGKIASWTRSHEMRTLVKQLVELAAGDTTSSELLKTSPLQDQLREELFSLAGEEVSFQLWDRNFRTIADEPGMNAIGAAVTPYGAAVLTVAFAGKPHLMTYDRDQQITTESSGVDTKLHAGTLTPVRDVDGVVIAVLLIVDHDAHEQVARIFRLADLGTSGETYAFNDDGLLLTKSRFDDQLRRLGLIPDDGRSTRVIHLRDPGGDLTSGYLPDEPLAVRPLTKMAQHATAGVDGVDVDGYRDYRGVEVVGAWRWLDEYQVGVATELDKNEMEPGLSLFVWLGWIIFGLISLCMAVVLYSYYSLYRLRTLVGENTQIGHYTLEEKIGEGGMGRVFRARHAHLKRPTAIKLLKPDLLDHDSIARFKREAQLASQLTHPNTIQIHDYGVTDEGLFYYVMEYVDGPSFAKEVELRGPLPPERVIHLLNQVCGSLTEAHEAGLIHRDLKPQNILLCWRGGCSDVVKVVDFGLVKHLGPQQSLNLTSPGFLAGTPLYIAPERLADPTSAAATTDIYSLGAVAFFLLAGREVFEGKSLADLLYQVANIDPPRPSEFVAGIPADLEQLVMDCLAKDPDDRPQSAAELFTRLLSVQCVV